MKKYAVGKNESGQRMDRFLSRILTNASWAEIQKLFRKKVFKRNGQRHVKPGDYVECGDTIEIFLSDDALTSLGCTDREHNEKRTMTPSSSGSLPKEIPLIYEDEDYFVVSKPSGMLIHSDTAHAEDDLTSVVRRVLSGYSDRFFAPATASRLDRGTSGIVVYAKNYQSLKKMNEEMRARRIERVYRCIVEGSLEGRGQISLNLHKNKSVNKVFAEDENAENGKSARTFYQANRVFGEGRFTLVTAVLDTGRSHQIRVSMAKLGHPIVGDVKYGSSFKRKAPLLHCAKVTMCGMHFESDSNEIDDFIRMYQ
ncbi:MAG: RluA family pseudouridine synthase [Bacillota bacterium]|nr:RluA family pseudouridine synthase [Bacillota bacterium]